MTVEEKAFGEEKVALSNRALQTYSMDFLRKLECGLEESLDNKVSRSKRALTQRQIKRIQDEVERRMSLKKNAFLREEKFRTTRFTEFLKILKNSRVRYQKRIR